MIRKKCLKKGFIHLVHARRCKPCEIKPSPLYLFGDLHGPVIVRRKCIVNELYLSVSLLDA